MKIYTRYNRPVGEQLTFNMPSLTEQHHRDDCDINTIVSRYNRTGILPVNNLPPIYGDVSLMPKDYAEATSMISSANSWFSSLPSALRSRFDNSPEKILSFLSDPANHDEAVKLGLVEAPKIEKPIEKTPVESPAEPATSASE